LWQARLALLWILANNKLGNVLNKCALLWTSTTPPLFQKKITGEILNDIHHCLDSIFFFTFYLHFTTKLNFKLLSEFYALQCSFFRFYDQINHYHSLDHKKVGVKTRIRTATYQIRIFARTGAVRIVDVHGVITLAYSARIVRRNFCSNRTINLRLKKILVKAIHLIIKRTTAMVRFVLMLEYRLPEKIECSYTFGDAGYTHS